MRVPDLVIYVENIVQIGTFGGVFDKGELVCFGVACDFLRERAIV